MKHLNYFFQRRVNPIVSCVILLLTAQIIATTQAVAAGSSVSAKNNKVLQKIIIEGERPEISACLTVAQQLPNLFPIYRKITWEPSMSNAAVLKEETSAEGVLKVISFRGMGLLHDDRLFHADEWVKVLIECQQINENKPLVTVQQSE
jgi:hypothetical protein